MRSIDPQPTYAIKDNIMDTPDKQGGTGQVKAVSDTSRFLPNWGAWMPNRESKFVENPYILVIKISMKILLNHNIPHKMSDVEMHRVVLIENYNSSSWGYLALGINHG